MVSLHNRESVIRQPLDGTRQSLESCKCNLKKIPIHWIDLEKYMKKKKKKISLKPTSHEVINFLIYCIARASLKDRSSIATRSLKQLCNGSATGA